MNELINPVDPFAREIKTTLCWRQHLSASLCQRPFSGMERNLVYMDATVSVGL